MAELLISELGRIIEGRSEQEIVAEIEKQGVASVLDKIFDGFAAAFVPAATPPRTAVVQFDVTAPDGVHSYLLNCADGKCEAQRANGEAARLTISLALPDFVRMVVGKIDGMQAFLSGKLRLTGDMNLAQSMPRWFKR